MNLNEIEAKCFIMALFIRDDGLRFLLGSGAYEFKDSQLMFAGNTIENDVVSVQGNDGYMLAGQVRRPNTQVFDGYIGDASVSKSEVEGYRRDFMAFFQKNHFYTVVYVMADGSAIQRRRGFLVDAPTSQELWQMYPEYHVALNFEDVNYYKYSENDEGEETYAKSADIGLAKVQYGGLIWDNDSEIEISGTGTNITLAGTMEGGAIESVELNGDTEQTTYSGKNLYVNSQDFGGSNWKNSAAWTTDSSTYNGLVVKTRSNAWQGISQTLSVESGKTYTFSLFVKAGSARNAGLYLNHYESGAATITPTSASISVTTEWQRYSATFSVTSGGTVRPRLELFENFDTPVYICGYQLEQNSSMTSFEPYVGGTASPNPDYPQEVQTVTGRQVVTITDGGSESQEYEINLGKNLLNPATLTADSRLNGDGTLLSGATGFSTSDYIPVEPNTTYTITRNAASSGFFGNLCQYDSSKTLVGTREYWDNTASYWPFHITTSSTTRYIRVSDQTTLFGTSFQLEKGSTATTYAPYFTPIELCKIGTYQDYIYKSGEDWYVHKETKLVNLYDTKDLAWWKSGSTIKINWELLGMDDIQPAASKAVVGAMISDHFTNTYAEALYNGSTVVGCAVGDDAIYFSNNGWDAATFKTYITNNIVLCYFALKTPTDTQITNATLISELEDLLSATTYSGTTYITVSGDLASPLEIKVTSIGGGGVVWDENGAEWEAGGGGEIVIVNVDSIENILPVWTIRGEAENPTLTNLTTGMSITYNGTVASGQTLVIDLLNKTAKLNGTSVISDVSGQWVEFKPGNNRVSYSTENANAPDSTIEWQEVVG